MGNRVSTNYFTKIQVLLPANKFQEIELDLLIAQDEKLEAFWNIIIAGYPVEFAISNYVQLYDYLKDKKIDYSQALTTYKIFPELEDGIYITKTKWFELN